MKQFFQLKGNHNDAYQLVPSTQQIRANLESAEIRTDDLIYKCRFVVERTNVWLDALKAILVRFKNKTIAIEKH